MSFENRRWWIATALGLCLLLAPAGAFAQSKQSVADQMNALAAQILATKATGGPNPAQLAQYQALSNQLGGYDPAGLANGSQPAGGQFRVAPAAPTGGTSTTASFSDSPALAIPDGPGGTISTTINVVSPDTYIHDVDFTVDITHTWNADLDIILTSPAGTMVTMSTGNGGSNDNVYSGSLFDDSAGTPVTDTLFVNLVTATPLTPEEALAAFIGEDPNGIWTLTVNDNANLDTGTINSWTLDITTLSAPPIFDAVASFTNNTATPIPDGPGGTVSNNVSVAGAGAYLCDVDFTVNITHTWNADLDIILTSPGGTVSTMSSGNGGSNDNVFAGSLFDDSAGTPITDTLFSNLVTATPLVPEEALGAFIGEDPNGTWTLTVNDNANLDTGTINSWTLDVTTCVGVAGGPDGLPIPTMSPIGIGALLLLLALAAVIVMRRRQTA